MDRDINTQRNRNRLKIVSQSGAMHLRKVSTQKGGLSCNHSIFVWLSSMRIAELVDYDMDDIEGLVFTDKGMELIE
jgi:hypothetical protein